MLRMAHCLQRPVQYVLTGQEQLSRYYLLGSVYEAAHALQRLLRSKMGGELHPGAEMGQLGAQQFL